MGRPVIDWGDAGSPPQLSPAVRRAVDLSIRYYDRYYDEASGMVIGDINEEPDPRSTFLCAISLLLSGEMEREAQGRALLGVVARTGYAFDRTIAVLTLLKGAQLLDEGTRKDIRDSLQGDANWEGEDIIAGRNINIPLATWARRIAAGVLLGVPDLVEGGIKALEKLVNLTEAHGTLPEFNSPTYHPITLMLLRTICLLGEERSSALAAMLESHLWQELAWRWHPRLRVLCGPWGRAYQDSMVGSSGLVQILADIAWGAFYDEEVAYRYKHAHDQAFGGVLAFLVDGQPADTEEVALHKELPLTVRASAEQVSFRFGAGERSTWVPGGVAELSTWMGEAIAVGTSSRPHIHGLQGAGYVAHWTRTGNTVKGISDLGQAFTKFVQNGRRPGSAHSLGNHHLGEPYRARIDLWPENGLSYALQSGPTALVTYVPKAQERWTVGRLEGMMVLPRLNTVDEVQVDGKAVETYLGDPDGWVLVRSGDASMGLRFGCCEDELTRPVIFVERSRDHLFCGLRVCDFAEERELSEHLYRRFGVLIGSEVRHTPSEGKIEEMVADLRESEISDIWPMATFGGPREVSFEMGPTRLAGRLDPVSGTWLERIEPKATGLHRRMCLRR